MGVSFFEGALFLVVLKEKQKESQSHVGGPNPTLKRYPSDLEPCKGGHGSLVTITEK